MSNSPTNRIPIDPQLLAEPQPLLIGHSNHTLEALRIAIQKTRGRVARLLSGAGLNADVDAVMVNIEGDIFINLRNRSQDAEPIENIESYAMSVAKHSALRWITDHTKELSQAHPENQVHSDQPTNLLRESADPIDILAGWEKTRLLFSILENELDSRNWSIFTQYAFSDISPSAIGKLFNLSERRIKEIIETCNLIAQTILRAMVLAENGQPKSEIHQALTDPRHTEIILNKLTVEQTHARFKIKRADLLHGQARKLKALALDVYEMMADS